MKEIKFLKDLPIKLMNTNKSVLSVVGGDIYYDNDGDRFGYITFKNLEKSPIFSLQLFIREYSIDGKFIRDNEFFESYTYYPKGDFVINEPILLDKETEAIEVTIVKLTLNRHNFVNDRFVAFKEEDYVEIYQRKAPVKKPGTASTFNFAAAPAPAAAPAQEQPVASEESSQPVREETSTPVQEERVAPAVEKEQPATAQAPVQEPEEEVASAPVSSDNLTYASKQKGFWKFIPPVIAVIAIAVLTFLVISAVTRGVNAFNSSLYY